MEGIGNKMGKTPNNHQMVDDFDRIADRLIIRCPICGKENKYPVEDKNGALWVCCGAQISINRKDLERIDNERNCATKWRDYGKDVVEDR